MRWITRDTRLKQSAEPLSVSPCSVWWYAVFFILALSACAPDFEDEPAYDQQGSTIRTLPADQAPTTDGVVTLEVTKADGTSYQAQAEANAVIVKFRSSATSLQQQRVMSAASVGTSTALSVVSGLTYTQTAVGQTLEGAIQALSLDPSVDYAEPNYLIAAGVTPNDSRFSTQWALHNTGQTGGSNDADIDAPEAWDLHTGNDVIIAVIDTGVDYNHSDLAGNIWTNTGEVPGNGRDDDGNGYVDDVRGWDFANNDNNPMDDHNHGTHVAGIIAAKGNNANGIVGVNWSARIMPLKFMTATGQGSTFAAIQAIEYAVANGARVSNNSWGGPGFSRALYDAIRAANTAGHVFVAAAGNANLNNDTRPEYPASFNLANIISVAATDSNDRRASFSNYGARTVDLGAPGVSILSTIRGNNYRTFSGTSMASPFVAGVAGLMLAGRPGLSVAGLKSALLDTVDPVASLNGSTVSGGRLNVFKALSQVMAGAAAAPTPSPTPAPVSVSINPGSAALVAGDTLRFSASGGTSPYVWSVSNTAIASISATGLLSTFSAGSLIITATDAGGNAATTGTVQITALAAQAPDPLVISPMSSSVGVGQTLRFTATGGVMPYSWSSSNPGIASMAASTGLLSALSQGSVRVSIVDNTGATASSNLISITRLAITPSVGVLPVGDFLQLVATGGTPPYSWQSSSPTVVQVSASGLLTARSTGNAVITVTDNGGMTASTGNVVVRNINLSPATASLQPGDTLRFSASGGAAPYAWSVSDTTVASIDATGQLTALANGTVNVSVADADGFGATSGTVLVGGSSNLITITPNGENVVITGWKLFTASGGTPPYSWRLRDPTAGFIYSDIWPGWFLANGSIGSTTTIIVVDANGNTGESGPVTTVGQ